MKTRRTVLAIVALALLHAHAWAVRDPEPLEAFELHELRISRISLKTSCGPTAYVMAPNGYVHRVRKGDYIGKHFGWVKQVSAQGLRLRELYEERKEDWKEREVWLRSGSAPVYPAEPAVEP